MDSIRDLYLRIKSSSNNYERSRLIEQFNESIDDSFTNRKKNILNHPYLEYIVSSKRGLNLFEQFLESYGLPIESFDRIYKMIESKKNTVDPKKSSFKNDNSEYMFEKYSSILKKLDDFKSKWSNAFIMFENTKSNLNYTDIYYEYAISKKPNTNKLLNKYGTGIIPDLIIFNNTFNSNDSFIIPIIQNPIFFNESNAQWMFESMKPYSKDSIAFKTAFLGSFDKKMCGIQKKINQNFIESVITRDFESKIFNESDIKTINDYIKFKESINRNNLSEKDKSILEHQINKAKDLKLKLEDSANIVADFLQNIVTEGLWATSSQGGSMPDYLKKNFDINKSKNSSNDEDIDEDDIDDEENSDEDYEDEINSPKDDEIDNGMEDYVRKSDRNKSPSGSGMSNVPDEMKDLPMTGHETATTSDGKVINYYYYNYSNSFNRHHDNSTNYNGSGYKPPKEFIDSKNKNEHVEIQESILYSIPNNKVKFIQNRANVFDLDFPSFFEEGETDDGRPESDDPLGDRAKMIDNFGRKVSKTVQGVGKIINSLVWKPLGNLGDWAKNLAKSFEELQTNQIKAELMNPKKRSWVWQAAGWLIKTGFEGMSGLLFNPLYWFYNWYKDSFKSKDQIEKLKSEILHELPTEIEILTDQIKIAESQHKFKRMAELKRIRSKLVNQLDNVKKEWKIPEKLDKHKLNEYDSSIDYWGW